MLPPTTYIISELQQQHSNSAPERPDLHECSNLDCRWHGPCPYLPPRINMRIVNSYVLCNVPYNRYDHLYSVPPSVIQTWLCTLIYNVFQHLPSSRHRANPDTLIIDYCFYCPPLWDRAPVPNSYQYLMFRPLGTSFKVLLSTVIFTINRTGIFMSCLLLLFQCFRRTFTKTIVTPVSPLVQTRASMRDNLNALHSLPRVRPLVGSDDLFLLLSLIRI